MFITMCKVSEIRDVLSVSCTILVLDFRVLEVSGSIWIVMNIS